MATSVEVSASGPLSCSTFNKALFILLRATKWFQLKLHVLFTKAGVVWVKHEGLGSYKWRAEPWSPLTQVWHPLLHLTDRPLDQLVVICLSYVFCFLTACRFCLNRPRYLTQQWLYLRIEQRLVSELWSEGRSDQTKQNKKSSRVKV